jgi:hypothetical protein
MIIMSLCDQPGHTKVLYREIRQPGTGVVHPSVITKLSANQTPSDHALSERRQNGAELLTI